MKDNRSEMSKKMDKRILENQILEVKKGCRQLFEQEDDVGMTMCGKRPLCPECKSKLDALEKEGVEC